MADLTDEERARMRKRWCDHFARSFALFETWQAECDRLMKLYRESEGKVCVNFPPQPTSEPFPEDLRGMTCGARTRAGTPCKRTDINRGARCRLHGGYSTGPTSDAGKAASSRNACKRTP